MLMNILFLLLIGMVYIYLFFMIFLLYVNLLKMDMWLLEVVVDLGVLFWVVFWCVIVLLLCVGIVVGLMLVFIFCVGEYVMFELLGGL